MTGQALQRALAGVDCELRFDNLTRQLYATDASIYQIEPLGVAFPRDARQASAIIRAAGEASVPIIPRGAGTGLVGGAIGEGVILDLARFNRQISNLDLERRTVCVGAGVVLDSLNGFLKPHGFCFGPDVATSSRATLGGMIANNSSGARTPFYGTTADHVRSLEIVLADGRIERTGSGHGSLAPLRERVNLLVRRNAAEITARMPPGLLKRWPGYGFDRWLRAPGNLGDILAGSEGTLATIVSAELKIVPLPREKGLGLIFFSSVADAMQATVALLDLKPAAIEHVDRVLFDQTRGQLAFQRARDLLELDAQPCEAFLIVEFYADVRDRLAALETRRLGLRTRLVTDIAEMNLVWALRKAGLSLLTGCAGPAKPVTCVEDSAVRPEQLPAYVAGLQAILKPLDVAACFYGHAASGLLHVRPLLDLHTRDDVRKLRQITGEVSALVRQFKGSFAAEHGVGLARTEFLREHLGRELVEAMREIKAAFDPRGVFNPGKLIDDGRYKIDTHLRLGPDHELRLPFDPILAFAAKDGSFVRNLEQCNGCGGCRKESPTMCPTFLAAGEEIMSTRGRANAIRAALELRGIEGGDPLRTVELDAALSNCLSCKACTTECPSNVNLALLKAELLHARHRRHGLPLRARAISHVDLLGRLGCLAPGAANAALEWRWFRGLLKRALGITDRRPLPRFARARFDRWFARRGGSRPGPRGKVILWDDTFARYHEPQIGQAAVAVLEAAGFEVILPAGRQCCGRPAFSQGNLDLVKRWGAHNLRLFASISDFASAPILFLEPSCWSMFVEDYRELKLPGAERVAGRCFLFEQFLDDLLLREPGAVRFRDGAGHVAIHAHCHAKSLLNPAFMGRLARRLPGRTVTMLETACCGMAGAFGVTEEKVALSLKVGSLMNDQIRQQPDGTVVVASGTSCRQQIEHLAAMHPFHMAEVLARELVAQ
jgi:FAD/FMN-containing dehydrogenase/Fe-S oxidoreductase